MKTILARAVIVLLLFACSTMARHIQQEQVHFKRGATGTSIHAEIRGDNIVDYQLQANSGQTLDINFQTDNRAAYFNVLPPDSDDVAIFVGSVSGNHFTYELPTGGNYTIRVYMMRSAARRNETAAYTLQIATQDKGQQEVVPRDKNFDREAPFDRSFELQGIRFRVLSDNNSSINTLTIQPSGLEIDNSPITQEIFGTVTGAEVADLNADNSPEIYIYITSVGSGSYGSLVAYSANRRKSLSDIYLPPLIENKAASKGYMGHDEFAVLEGVLGRRFPIYREGDANAKPTGGIRQLQYKLLPGEAGWLLKIDRTTEY